MNAYGGLTTAPSSPAPHSTSRLPSLVSHLRFAPATDSLARAIRALRALIGTRHSTYLNILLGLLSHRPTVEPLPLDAVAEPRERRAGVVDTVVVEDRFGLRERHPGVDVIGERF